MLAGAAFVVLGTMLYRHGGPVSEKAKETLPPAASPTQAPETDSITTTPAPLRVREAVLQLTGQLGDGAPKTRRDALEVLPLDLNKKELETIYARIVEHSRPEAFPRRAWHAFFNDTLNALVLDQKNPVADLPGRLLAVVEDSQRHRVIRDYALQHLLAFAEYRAEPSERVDLLETAWQAISQTRDSFRGTYLLATAYRAGDPGWPTEEDISKKAWQVASADDANVLSRISALQVCGKLGYQEALPLALEIAADTGAHMTLRTSAIATIGDLGSEAERGELVSLARRSPPRLRVAIEAAILRIDGKRKQA